MRLAVIDASPVGGGPVSHALSYAAAEAGDGDVVRVRTFDLFVRVCSSCSACTRSGRCSRHHPALDAAIAELADADALLVGCAGHFRAHDPRSHALLERLVGAFGHVETARGLDGVRSQAGARKRAALVFGAPPLMGVPAILGIMPSGATKVWRTLERANTAIVRCETVGSRWAGPTSRDRATESARRLGRALAAPANTRGAGRTVDARRVAAALVTTTSGL